MSETLSEKLRSAANGLDSFKTVKGDFGLADEAADEIDRLRAENARLREALIDAADMLSGATFEVMRVRGQYIDRKDVVCRARATLQNEGERNE